MRSPPKAKIPKKRPPRADRTRPTITGKRHGSYGHPAQHDYTVDNLHHLARYVVHSDAWHTGGDVESGLHNGAPINYCSTLCPYCAGIDGDVSRPPCLDLGCVPWIELDTPAVLLLSTKAGQ